MRTTWPYNLGRAGFENMGAPLLSGECFCPGWASRSPNLETLSERWHYAKKVWPSLAPMLAHMICLTNLTIVFTELGQHLKARDVLQRALVVDQQSGSEEDVATSIKNLGYAYWNLGDYAIAQRHLENALAIFERTQGLQGSDVTNIQTDLAELAEIIAAPSQEIEELNPWCFLTLGMIVLALALAAHLQSLTFLTLGVILLSHIRWRA